MRTGRAFREYLALREARYQAWLDPATGVASARVSGPASCPLCGSDAPRAWFVKRGFRWVRCGRCRTVYVSPGLTPEARRTAYCGPDAEFYYRHCLLPEEGEGGWQEELARIRRYRRPGRLLDVACGAGGFLRCARRAGWEAWGVEVNPLAAARAREGGGRVEAAGFEVADLPEASFDVVTIFQALDQLADPLWALRRMRRLLRPGGLLVAAVPNIRSFIVWALGPRHRHFTPEKGVCFTPRTLRRMVGRAGFERILELRTFGEECTLSNLRALARTGWGVDLFEHRASQNGEPGAAGGASWLRLVGRGVDRLLIALSRRAGLGSYASVYAEADS